jgi:anti-sigma B factor antagonist
MEIRTSRSEGAARLELHGELDLGTAPVLDEAVEEVLDGGCRDLVLDLGGTTFLDSSGLGALMRVRRAADEHQARMAVVSPPGSEARVVIELSRTAGIVGLRDA